MWRCLCECGATVESLAKAVRSGNTKSCGCLKRDRTIARNIANSAHGLTGSRAHTAWINMRERCLNPKHDSYHRYGGRGIGICKPWLESFTNFLDDMGHPPSGMSLDRIDVNGDYEPGNCRWATSEEQANNRDNNRCLEFGGKKQTVAQWARELGASRAALRYRLEAGWTVEETLTMKVDHKNRRQQEARA
jgi:hypothetical protein